MPPPTGHLPQARKRETKVREGEDRRGEKIRGGPASLLRSSLPSFFCRNSESLTSEAHLKFARSQRCAKVGYYWGEGDHKRGSKLKGAILRPLGLLKAPPFFD